MTDDAAAPQIWAVEICDLDEHRVLAFDLPELLDALGARAADLDWIVTDYEPVTEDGDVETFADRVYEAQTGSPRTGVRLTSQKLRSIADRTRQTINGQFIGISSDTASPTHKLVDLRTFPTSNAALVIKAVDSSFWIVITKAADDIAAVHRRFTDVRESDRTLELGYAIGP
jgi:hypothetical protein